ncbi:MAG: phosphatidate cytidylyltransferase [Planctomycetes bacterium]|nr:phosphatidate cytidylyltransferase [Planctomycetota bacterium]MBI3843925.1 phosphatidate cytidylyltransferase [Planctomycetota bacterium]
MAREAVWLFTGVIALLVVATAIGRILRVRMTSEAQRPTIENLNARIRAWWVMVAVFALTIASGGYGSIVLFGILSFLALREFITLTPTRRGDHMALFWVFFVITPLQYVLVGMRWYGLFSILIPVYAFLFLPVRIAMFGDAHRFLERAAKIQFALMICVYCVSHVPALLMLEIRGYEGRGALLLFFLVFVVQMSDVLQYVFGKLLGRHAVASAISPKKTWEGLIGGVLTATALGTALWWATPFTPIQAAGMAFAITVAGFAGGLTMSAIKRDSGVKDFGRMIEGHGGILDRIDSLCFAGPIFFHLTRYFFA